MSSKPFLLLEPGPLVADEAHQRGDADLLEANSLSRIVGHVMRSKPGDYQTQVLCLGEWRRKGAAYDVAPLAAQHPHPGRPDFQPLPPAALADAFTLAPGGMRLGEAEKGEPLHTNFGGLGTPSVTAASGGGPQASAGGVAPAAGPPKIKLRVKPLPKG